MVEVQSDLFHSGLVDRARDRERIARLRRAGWIVVEISEHEIWYRKDQVVAKVRGASPRPGLPRPSDPWLSVTRSVTH